MLRANRRLEELTNEALAKEHKLVRRIITRLIKTDQTLIVVELPTIPTDGTKPDINTRIISVNPNYPVNDI